MVAKQKEKYLQFAALTSAKYFTCKNIQLGDEYFSIAIFGRLKTSNSHHSYVYWLLQDSCMPYVKSRNWYEQ